MTRGSGMSKELDELVAEAERTWRERWDAGPQRTSWTDLPPQVGDPAPEATLPDHAGEPVSLQDLWSERPLLLIFWRHFGCGCGVDRADRLRDEHRDLQAAGANVVIVGQGQPPRADAYRKRYALPCPILCDPEMEVYDAYGTLDALAAEVLFDAPLNLQERGAEATDEFVEARREMGRPLVDDPWRLPSEFVIDTSGTIRLAWRYNHCEDFPDPRVHLQAIREAQDTS